MAVRRPRKETKSLVQQNPRQGRSDPRPARPHRSEGARVQQLGVNPGRMAEWASPRVACWIPSGPSRSCVAGVGPIRSQSLFHPLAGLPSGTEKAAAPTGVENPGLFKSCSFGAEAYAQKTWWLILQSCSEGLGTSFIVLPCPLCVQEVRSLNPSPGCMNRQPWNPSRQSDRVRPVHRSAGAEFEQPRQPR